MTDEIHPKYYVRAYCMHCKEILDAYIPWQKILCMECYMRLENEDRSPNITAMLQDTMENEVRE